VSSTAKREVPVIGLNKLGWNFPVNDDGQENGLNDPGIETFKDNPLSSLARECLQNSADAADSSGKPVEVHFQRLEIPKVRPGNRFIVLAQTGEGYLAVKAEHCGIIPLNAANLELVRQAMAGNPPSAKQ